MKTIRNHSTALLIILLFSLSSMAQNSTNTISDSKKSDLSKLFNSVNTTYVIKYNHDISGKTLIIPKGCTLRFNGGKITGGTIVFNGTTLDGTIKMTGCTVKGKITNDRFKASWVCYKDGKSDDARIISCAIDVCPHIVFPKGTYRLKSLYRAPANNATITEATKNSHIGINQSNVTLEGEKGATLLTEEEGKGILCIYSKPNNIGNSIKNITIKNLRFLTKKKSNNFHEQAHCIKVVGVDGLLISNCEIDNFWGDAICLGHFGDTPQTGERARNMNVTIINNSINGMDHNNRNGISVINGQNVNIESNIIISTSARNMPGAIDIEPNNSAYTINNIFITNNHIKDCNGGVGAVAVVANANGGPAHNIYIKGNVIERSRRGLFFQVKSDNTTSNIQVEDNHVDKYTDPFLFDGEGKSRSWVFKNNVFDRSTHNPVGGKIRISGFDK